MKKMLLSVLLLLGSIVYLVWKISANPVYLPDISMKVKNPVTFHWSNIQINTGAIKNASMETSQEAIYHVSLLPVYLMILVALILMGVYLKNKK